MSSAKNQYAMQNPLTQFPQPTFPEQTQEAPGTIHELQPKADHGEQSYQGFGRLQGRKALITGADSGIGRATAIAYAREGADIVLNYLPEEEQDAAEVVQLIQAEGRKDIADITTEQFDATFKTNVYAMFWLCKAAIPHLPPGASIINTGSIQSYQPSPTLLDYASTKAAIVNFTKGLAQQVAEKGIRVNAVAPGPVWTPLQPSGGQPPEKIPEFGSETPMKRAGQPVEMAPLYVLLASQESSYVTGEVFGATGGLLLS
ncbi:SDR family oxidoreductase [Xanthomonas campestris pv. incanae]|uniref:SDR family oxidoreductase n=1 Tax=Xanthomonas campestris TaxID=339 RepID=UPI0023685598|nr:SDR family oxidoreductase [Xanthomonas campestris]WDK24679.1 SDR family oxidoreductase [Xanthomonas campestris pv. incanae]